MDNSPHVILLRITLALVVPAILLVPRVAAADWPPTGRAVSATPGVQGGQVMAPDGAGGTIIAWKEERLFPFNVDVQHLLASGDVDPTWPANGRAESRNPVRVRL